MEPEIIFVPSAFKHKVTEADILNAYKTRVYDRLMEGCDNKYGFIGFNQAGNPIEVFYNPVGEDTIKVFHAMGLRPGALEELRG
ncbi:MAG: hypothetical protein LBT68_02325 [Spirochaetales bacterium]|nr:hypothetical protein [Spirochaetales bacterium]